MSKVTHWQSFCHFFELQNESRTSVPNTIGKSQKQTSVETSAGGQTQPTCEVAFTTRPLWHVTLQEWHGGLAHIQFPIHHKPGFQPAAT
jgi:hypothetical protein